MKTYSKKKATKTRTAVRFKRTLKRVLEYVTRIHVSPRNKKVFVFLCILGIIFIGWGYAKRVVVNYGLKNMVVSEGEIIKRIKIHSSVPEESPTSIVRVQNAESLRAQHVFYKDVKEGNYIVVYSTKLIIYDLQLDKIVAEKTFSR